MEKGSQKKKTQLDTRTCGGGLNAFHPCILYDLLEIDDELETLFVVGEAPLSVVVVVETDTVCHLVAHILASLYGGVVLHFLSTV